MREIYDMTVYSPADADYESEGLCGPLTPMGDPSVVEEAGGEYSLDFEHPYDAAGRWRHLTPGNVVRAWVLMRVPPQPDDMGAYAGTVEVWQVKATAAKADRYLYSKKSGGKRLKLLTPGAEVVVLEAPSSGRYSVKCSYGTGYMEPAGLDASTRETVPVEQDSAALDGILGIGYRPQLFDIVSIERTYEGIQVHAQHISYRLMKNVASYKNSGSVSAIAAGAAVLSACVNPHDFTIQGDVADLRTGVEWSWRNPIDILLNPEDGILARWGCELMRDNFDLYLLHSAGADRGVNIELGKNLAGITVSEDWTDVATWIMPLGQAADGSVLLLPERGLVSARAADYPDRYIYAFFAEDATVGGGVDEQTVYTRMRAQAQALLDGGCDLPQLTIDIEVAQVDDPLAQRIVELLEPVLLYDTVHVYDPERGIEYDREVIRREVDPVSGRLRAITLGTTTGRLGSAPLAAWQIPDGINGGKILWATIGGEQIAAGGITTGNLADGAVDGIKLADLAVTGGKLADDAVTESKMAAGAVTSDKLDDGAVTEDKLDASAVTEDKIADGAVTYDKLAVGALKVGELRDNSANPNMAWKLSNLDAGTDELDLILIHDDEDGYVARINGLSTPTGSGGGITPQTYDYLHTLRLIARNYKNEGGGVANQERASLELDPHYVFPSGNTYPALVALGSIVPDATNNYDLGTSTTRWRRIYLNNNPNVSSDARIKEGVRDLDGGLIDRLRPRSFRMRGDPSGRARMGFVAQEVQRALAEADLQDSDLVADEDPAHLGLHYEQIIAPLVAKVQELTERIKKLEAEGDR